MSVKITGQRNFTPATPASCFVGNTASVSFFLRVDTETNLTQAIYAAPVSRLYDIGLGVAFRRASDTKVNLELRISDTLGNTSGVTGAPTLTKGVVYHIAVVYRQGTPKSTLYVNGIGKDFDNVMTSGVQTGGGAGVPFQIGNWYTDPVVLSLENLAIWNDRILSPAEVTALRNATQTPADTFATAWWTLTGATGAAATVGDAGLNNSIGGGGRNIDTAYGTGTAVYGAAMPYTFSARVRDAWVATSGRVLTVRFTPIDSLIYIMPSSIVFPPTITRNGTPLPDLGVPIFMDERHTCLSWLLPAGVRILPSDTVLFSATQGWVSTEIGLGRAESNVVVTNRVGKSVIRPDNYIPPIPMGVNHAAPGPVWSSGGTAMKNIRRKFTKNWGGGATLTRDGKPTRFTASSVINNQMFNTNPKPAWDALNSSPSCPRGLYAIGWDDLASSTPTTFILEQFAQGCKVVEKVDGRNYGINGIGQVRVFDVQYHGGGVTLTAGIDDGVQTTIAVNSVIDMYATAWVKFGGEYMEIVSIAGNNLTVKRGQYGSTAALHGNGTVGTWGPDDYRGEFQMRATAPAGTLTPSMENFVFYGPGDFTYTPGVPTVLDRSDDYATSARIMERIANTNCIRWMDNTGFYGGNLTLADPEDLRIATDWSWGEPVNFTRNIAITGAVTYPATGGYIYGNTFGDPYTATLASAIDNAQTTITISDALTAPVLAGQFLVVGTEQMRVISTDGTTSVVVERGSVGTTRASHVAGTIAVRYRGSVPFNKNVPYNNTSPIAGASYIHLTTTIPHGLKSGINLSLGDWTHPDINVTYRKATLLIAGISATGPGTTLTSPITTAPVVGTVETISVATSAGAVVGLPIAIGRKWEGEEFPMVMGVPVGGTTLTISRGMHPVAPQAHPNGAAVSYPTTISVGSTTGMLVGTYIKVGSESMRIVEVTNATTLRVLRGRYASVEAPHASGTPANSFCPGTIMQDGTLHDWLNETHLIYATGPNSFFFLAGSTNACTIGPNQVLDLTISYSKPESATYPHTFTMRSTSAFPRADYWVNTQHPANDALLYKIATEVRDNTIPGRKVFVEAMNEPWNATMMPTETSWTMQAWFSLYQGQSFYYVVWRAGKVSDIFRQVFNEGGRNRGGEIKTVVNCQFFSIDQVTTTFAAAQLYGVEIGAIATAPYVNPDSFTGTPMPGYFAISDNDQAIDIWVHDLYFNNTTYSYPLIMASVLTKIAAYNSATGYACEHVGYEGGLSQVIGTSETNPGVVPNFRERNIDCSYRPNMYIAEQDMYALYAANYTHYNLFNLENGYFYGDSYIYMWGIYTWPGQDHGRGDGSDGKADNRLYDLTPGLPTTIPPRVPYELNKVSVRGQALIDWNAAAAAGGGGADVIAPTVTARTPASGATSVSISSTVTAAFSEAVQSGTISMTLTVGGSGSVAGTTTYNAGTKVATFTPSSALAASTTYTMTVSGAQDTAGNTMTTDSWTFTTGAAPDTTPPTVATRSPAAGAIGVSISTTIAATFSEALQPGTATISLFDGGGSSVAGSIVYNVQTLTATFTPSTPLNVGTTYTANSSGARDIAGNTMSTVSWGFTTAALPPPPPPVVNRRNKFAARSRFGYGPGGERS